MEVRPSPALKVNVPDYAHYIVGGCILVIGIIGTFGNLLVMYTFYRDVKLRTPANLFILSRTICDFLMSVTQAPIFFVNSLYKEWILGDLVCKVYAFCGALFGITSMTTLLAISIDRYIVITKPLESLRWSSKKRTLQILVIVWLYSLGWSLAPLLGWSSYVPEGLMTSCTWDYVTYSAANRSYTMVLCCCVFFVPLLIISYCYLLMFAAIRKSGRDVNMLGTYGKKLCYSRHQSMQNEWKMAKIAFIAIIVFVLSWSPYACITLIAWAGHAHILTPYSKSVPAVIAKASAIYNPIIYGITHPKFRSAICKSFSVIVSPSKVPKHDGVLHSLSDSSFRDSVSSRQSSFSRNKVLCNPSTVCTDVEFVKLDTKLRAMEMALFQDTFNKKMNNHVSQ
ncbi:melanopsin-B-like [Protopterus annectens]|uniref:melanopsin-B-like n=1 Tax=Protopterus annectens TaxID=7888 RepID=UPI001CF986AA|nr:melanopsin-B-like [Protopterus annectens]